MQMQTLRCQIRKDSGPEKKAPESFSRGKYSSKRKGGISFVRKKYICILAAVIGFCSLSGCGSSAKKTEEEQVTIGVVTKSKSSEYWLSVCDGMKDAAEKYHADVVILSPDSETEEDSADSKQHCTITGSITFSSI